MLAFDQRGNKTLQTEINIYLIGVTYKQALRRPVAGSEWITYAEPSNNVNCDFADFFFKFTFLNGKNKTDI